MLINQVWQPLGGTRNAQIYPYFRKPDLLSSNSCLIQTPEQLILIDAGALAGQTADLQRVVKACNEERPRPVVIYQTHCHMDHSLQLTGLRQVITSVPVWIAAQEEGACFLSEGDSQKTMAELYGVPFPSIQPDIRLLTAQDRKRANPRSIQIAPGTVMTLWMEEVPTKSGTSYNRQIVSIGGGDFLEIYPAQGHSPDSICIRIGDVFFVGDLLAAANPMIAGLSGWHKDDLLKTIEQTRWVMENLSIRCCYPGHGWDIAPDKMMAILLNVEKKTKNMGELVAMDEARLFAMTDYAMELIDEAEEVFSSLAGRLLYVAFQLERLEEDEAALRCRSAMPMDQIDACLLEFRMMCQMLDAGKIMRVEFAHGSLKLVKKLRKLFDPHPVSAVLPRSMIVRATSLLLDFLGIASGRRNLEEFIPMDVNALIASVVTSWQSGPHADTTIIDDADDYEKYLAALVLRIGYQPEADRPALTFYPAEGVPYIYLAGGRFFDTLFDFLQWLGRRHPSSLAIATRLENDNVSVAVSFVDQTDTPFTPHEQAKLRSFSRRFRLCGMTLNTQLKEFVLTPVGEERADAAP